MAQKSITPEIARQLLETGGTETLTGFKSKVGKDFEAQLKLVGGEVRFVFG